MIRKPCRTMSAFYDACGAFIRSHIVESGAFPKKVHTAIFEYERGEARFDGRKWEWELDVTI